MHSQKYCGAVKYLKNPQAVSRGFGQGRKLLLKGVSGYAEPRYFLLFPLACKTVLFMRIDSWPTVLNKGCQVNLWSAHVQGRAGGHWASEFRQNCTGQCAGRAVNSGQPAIGPGSAKRAAADTLTAAADLL